MLKSSNNIYLVYDFLNGDSIRTLINSYNQKGTNLNEKYVNSIMVQILDGLLYL